MCISIFNYVMSLEQTLLTAVVSRLKQEIDSFIVQVNQECPPYQKGRDTQDKGINKSFEHLARYVVDETLREMIGNSKPYYGQHLADIPRVTENFILQCDAKGCKSTDREFIVTNQGLKGHCGIAQTSLTSTRPYIKKNTIEPIIQKGLLTPVMNDKKVITMVVFLRWDYKDSYYIESYGATILPHSYEDVIFPYCGKSTDEMRWVITNPNLFIVERPASQSTLQTLDSAQSEHIEVPTALQQSQLCQNQQMDPEQPHQEDRMPLESS